MVLVKFYYVFINTDGPRISVSFCTDKEKTL